VGWIWLPSVKRLRTTGANRLERQQLCICRKWGKATDLNKKKQLVFNALKYGVIWNSELLITVFFKECFKQPLVFYKIKQYSFEVRGDESLQLRFGLTVR